VRQTEEGSLVAVEPSVAQTIMRNMARSLEKVSAMNCQPVVMCATPIRSHFKKLMDRFIPNVPVLSYDEVLASTEIQSLDMVELGNAD
jgi:flagellar biosynthesis protein FlhA